VRPDGPFIQSGAGGSGARNLPSMRSMSAFLERYLREVPICIFQRESATADKVLPHETKRIDLLERFPNGGDYSSRTKSLHLPVAPLISPPATSRTPLAVSFLHRSASKSQ